MTVYLNDLSLGGGNGLLADWDKFKAFSELIDELIRVGQVSLVAPKDLWQKPLGGVDVPSKTLTDGTSIPADQGLFVHQVYRKFKPKTDGEPLFSEDENMAMCSSSVGEAAESGAPVISITFDNRYAKEKLDGWLKSAGKDESPASVNNLFSGSKEEKRERFIRYGREVARLNGWIHNSRVSAMNSTATKKRVVFDSERLFTGYAISYLCIDLEGPDLCFELCDKHGYHLGEVDRYGNVSEPEQHHNLTV